MKRSVVGGIATLLLVGPAAFAAAPATASASKPAIVAPTPAARPPAAAKPLTQPVPGRQPAKPATATAPVACPTQEGAPSDIEGTEGEFPPDLVADGPGGSEITEESENDLETLFHEHLLAGKSAEAEAALRSALATAPKPLPAHLARMMMSMGNQYAEDGVIASAQFWLERTIREGGSQPADEESGKTIGSLVGPRLEWLKSGGQRPWCQSDAKKLAESLSAAVIKNDRAALMTMLTKVDPYVGEWQSEWEPCQGSELLDFLGQHWKAGITWDARDVFQKALAAQEKVLYLNTHGWVGLETHKNIQFAIQKVPQGWEWRGIVLGE